MNDHEMREGLAARDCVGEKFFLINSRLKRLPLCGVSLFSDSLLEALKTIT